MTKGKKKTAKTPKSKATKEQSGDSGAPMAMGMGMAKKMMGPMDKGAPDPMAMKKKMMAKMASAEEGSPGNPMMQICKDMMGTIKQTNEMALHATPELQGLFADWLGVLEGEAMEHLANHPETEVEALAEALKINKESAVYLVARLSIADKVSLTCRPSAKGTRKTAKKDTRIFRLGDGLTVQLERIEEVDHVNIF